MHDTPLTLSLVVNGEPFELACDADRAPLEALLDALSLTATRGVAVAINDRVAPRSTWPERVVVAGDRVEIIRATQGG